MVSLKSFKKLINQVDMFCSSELLRYRSDTQHKTLTGGLLSLAIICVVVVGFASMVADTLQRTTINSSMVTQKNSNPPLTTLKPGRDSMFMLGFSVQSLDLSFLADLNHGPQYFTITISTIKIVSGIVTYQTNPLEKCSH